MTNGLTQQDSISTCTNSIRSINYRLGASLRGCRSVYFLTNATIALKGAVLAYLVSRNYWVHLCLCWSWHVLVLACGVQRSITHGSSHSWLSVTEHQLSPRDNIWLACSERNTRPGTKKARYAWQHPLVSAWESCSVIYPSLWSRACKRVAGLDSALRHVFFDLYDVFNILEVSFKNQDFQLSLKKLKGALWHH